MKKKVKYSLSDCLTAEFVLIDVDLSTEQRIDSVANEIMDCLKDKVSNELYELLMAMLRGFNEEIQLEMADDMLDFTMRQVIHTTGCCSVDAVLETCYSWIAEEQGILRFGSQCYEVQE